jgi:NAD(P)-dependent dehydrogenase (short-subunit alcohol dehydrogenase family)
MQELTGRVAVITGAASGFGREFARLGAKAGLRLVLADVQDEPLAALVQELGAQGTQVVARRTDVAKADQVAALADLAYEHFGTVHLVFNNAGVGAGGLLWESSLADWEWVLGVNLWGVIHGVRSFTPRMIEEARRDPGYHGHIINTASVAGLLSPPNMGVYNVSKHAVVALSETLYQDLQLTEPRLGVSVLCPAFVPTGIAQSHRNRPPELKNPEPVTPSQRQAQEAIHRAVESGKITAADIAAMTFAAIRERRFYILTHPNILASVSARLEDIIEARSPRNPLAIKPGSGPGPGKKS